MIAGLLTPLVAGNYTFPPELKGELLQVIPDYATEVSPGRFNLKDITGKAAYAEALLNSIRVRTKASRFLMRRHSWDAFMVVFTELDRIQHSSGLHGRLLSVQPRAGSIFGITCFEKL